MAASSIALSTRLEMRAVRDDALLWRVDGQRRNIALPLTINPLDIPFLLVDIWKNFRGRALDLLAYQVYGDVVATVPGLEEPVEPFVEAAGRRVPLFRAPGLWRFQRAGWAPAGTRYPVLLEKRGRFQCEGPEGDPVWLFRRDVRLVDQEGTPLG